MALVDEHAIRAYLDHQRTVGKQQPVTAREVTTWTDLAAKYGQEAQDGDVTVQGTVDSMDDEVEAGAELVRYRRRVEALEAKAERLRFALERMTEARDNFLGLYNDSQAQLKVMTEDRDEYRNAIRACAPMAAMLKDATEDEQAIALAFVRKLMGEGRREHGALDLVTDKRTVEDLLREALDEALDSVSYVLMAQRKAGL